MAEGPVRAALGVRLYDHLVTRGLAELVRERGPREVEITNLEEAEAPLRLSRHFAAELFRGLRAIKGERQLERQIGLCNELLQRLRAAAPDAVPEEQDVAIPGELLFALHQGTPPLRTELPFAVTTLLTRAHGEPQLGHELSREIATADSIDALVSFVTLSGFRCLQPALDAHAQAGRRLRLLTTTYTGATEAAAVEAIANLPGVEVRISFDARRTRLHAKAWLFVRPNGLDTGYVGSANLSRAALFSGHEWMVKVAQADMPHVLDKFRGAFESLWEDPEFEAYDPADDAHRARLRSALRHERGETDRESQPRWFFTLRPYPFQLEILERLEAERTLHERRRNLVVAATGTGKTVIAAFDYQRQIHQSALRPRLLFLAHREEILRQARDTFRHVLRDESFGELLAGGRDPATFDYLFATVQSVNARGLLDRFAPDHWEYVVVDECHHLPAPSYQAFIERIRPRLLLGLTATPERSDGRSLLPDFGDQIAAELRLWHALERQLLAPFEYYGLHDGVDLRAARWGRGAYAEGDLDRLYTGNDRRAELVAAQLARRLGGDGILRMRALGFCVSVAHADFMARKFRDLGIPALAVHGESLDEERGRAPRRLESREVNVLFTCDLYNEGVDLPFVDTLLFLRPTSSPSLFLQQLGRGLRLHEGKETCLVLDFIGQHRREFRFDRLLSALTGLPRGSLREAVERGFPTLPSGCHLDLDPVARGLVLDNVKAALRGGRVRLGEELRAIGNVGLREFLEKSGRELEDVYDAGGWTAIRRAAGILGHLPMAGEEDLGSKLRLITHVDDPERLQLQIRTARALLPRPDAAAMVRDIAAVALEALPSNNLDRRRLLMLGYQLFPAHADQFGADAVVRRFVEQPSLCAELLELSQVLLDQVALASAHPLPDASWPLALHRRYSRREILTAVGRWTESQKPDAREGMVRLAEARTEILFVTLDKSHRRFSPTTRYEDYAISDRLFHWQSQSGTSPESPAGRRYIEQRENGWRFLLYVRPTAEDAFTYLGPVHYRSHSGSRPMSITWELDVAIPGTLLQRYATLSA
jgi:superfamily II DNA or RNA helicase/HKD family nuclease